MKTIKYIKWENGSKCLSTEGKETNILEEISKEEFEKRFPEISTYELEYYSPVYLENGLICLDTEWNGEAYIIKQDGREITIRPVYKELQEDDFKIIGYEEI